MAIDPKGVPYVVYSGGQFQGIIAQSYDASTNSWKKVYDPNDMINSYSTGATGDKIITDAVAYTHCAESSSSCAINVLCTNQIK